jgi:hypothetical protein
MNTFCLPDTTYGTIQLKSTPSGKKDPFEVKVQFNIPGGCDGTYKQLTVFVGSLPAGILCDPAKLGSDCSATTTCEASKAGTFKLIAQLKGVAGIVTEPAEVVVPGGGGGGVRGTKVRLTIDTPFGGFSPDQRQGLADGVADNLNDLVQGTGASVSVDTITEGSIVIVFSVTGTPEEVAAAVLVIQAGLPDLINNLARLLATQGVFNDATPPALISASDITAVILVNGVPIGPPTGTPPPAAGGSPPPPPVNRVVVTITAEAQVDTSSLTSIQVQGLADAILAEAKLTAGSTLAQAGADIDSVTISAGSPTICVVTILTPPAFAETIKATLTQTGTQNALTQAVYAVVREFFAPVPIPDFPITWTAT